MSPAVKVTLLRRRGKRVKRSIADNEQQYTGSITSFWLKLADKVSMRTGLPTDAKLRLPPDLLQPTLESIRPHGVTLMGYEDVGDAVYAQEWQIEFLLPLQPRGPEL